jgi:hypothetical protein
MGIMGLKSSMSSRYDKTLNKKNQTRILKVHSVGADAGNVALVHRRDAGWDVESSIANGSGLHHVKPSCHEKSIAGWVGYQNSLQLVL